MGKRICAEESLGVRYGKLVVVEILPPKDGRSQARAVCDCGAEWVGRVNALRSGNAASCGCETLKFEDFTGRKFGRWIALECVQRSGHGRSTLWRCVCECGTVSDVQAGALKNGFSRSCGCLAVELSKSRGVHLMTGSPEYHSWQAIKRRCLDPKDKDFKNYGGRGIKMFEPWISDFQAFYRYVGDRPCAGYTIERSENDGDYVPGNISWQPRSVQANNNRGNHRVTIDGVTRTLAQWCCIFNVSYPTVVQRINHSKWDPADALRTPTRRPFRGTRQKNRHQADPRNDVVYAPMRGSE